MRECTRRLPRHLRPQLDNTLDAGVPLPEQDGEAIRDLASDLRSRSACRQCSAVKPRINEWKRWSAGFLCKWITFVFESVNLTVPRVRSTHASKSPISAHASANGLNTVSKIPTDSAQRGIVCVGSSVNTVWASTLASSKHPKRTRATASKI